MHKVGGVLGSIFVLPTWTAVAAEPVGTALQPSIQPDGMNLDQEAKKKILAELIEPFKIEHLAYTLSFIRLFQAAEADILLDPGPEDYQVTGVLTAKATGVLGWLSNYREEIFTSVMEAAKDPINGRNRLVAKEFKRRSIVGDREYESKHTFDYGAERIWSYKIYEDGKLKSGRQTTIAPGVIYENFVSLFYNFRSYVYGGIEHGHEWNVHTVPYKGVDTFGLRIATDEELEAEGSWYSKIPGADFMLIVNINQKIFGINAGKARLLGSMDMIPVAAAVKDAVVFGTVEAKLINNPYA